MYCKKNTTPNMCLVVSLPFSRIWVWFLVLRPTYTDSGFFVIFLSPFRPMQSPQNRVSATLVIQSPFHWGLYTLHDWESIVQWTTKRK